jgi:hypothetical protein
LTFEEADSRLQEEKRALVTSRDNLDRLYRDSSNSLTILESEREMCPWAISKYFGD